MLVETTPRTVYLDVGNLRQLVRTDAAPREASEERLTSPGRLERNGTGAQSRRRAFHVTSPTSSTPDTVRLSDLLPGRRDPVAVAPR